MGLCFGEKLLFWDRNEKKKTVSCEGGNETCKHQFASAEKKNDDAAISTKLLFSFKDCFFVAKSFNDALLD